MAMLESYNVFVGSKRTSVRLEPLFWNILRTAAKKTGVSISEVCSRVDGARKAGSFTSNLRTFILAYQLHESVEDALKRLDRRG